MNTYKLNTNHQASQYNTHLTENLPAICLSEFSEEVIQYSHTNHRPSTTTIYRSTLDNLKDCIGDPQLPTISIKEIEYYKSFRQKKINRTSVNIELRTIKSSFNHGVRWGYLIENPAKDVKQLPIPENEIISFSKEQLREITDSIDDLKFKTIIKLAYSTGMRLNEITNLQWNDIDMQKEVIYVRNKEGFLTKSGKNRVIPISYDLGRVLTDYKKFEYSDTDFYEADYVFKGKDNHRHDKGYISKRFKKYLRKLGFDEKFHFHCLRHTFLTAFIGQAS